MSDYGTTVGINLYDDFSKITTELNALITILQNVKKEMSELKEVSKQVSQTMKEMSNFKFDTSSANGMKKSLQENLNIIKEMSNKAKQIQFSNVSGSVKNTANSSVVVNPADSYNTAKKTIMSYINNLKKAKSSTTELGKTSENTKTKISSMFAISSSTLGKLYFFSNYFKQVFRGIGNTIKSALDFTETENYFAKAMGDMYDNAMKFQNKLSEMYGLAMPTMMNAQASYKNMIGTLGELSDEVAYKISETVTKMTLDFSSLYNVDFENAVTKFQSALSKQVRPIRSTSGMDITQNVLGATASELGITRSISQMNELEKRLLIVLTLMKQMQNSGAMNDFALTIEQPSNQLRILKEQLSEVGRWIGSVFYGVIGHVLPYINGFVMAIKELVKMFALFVGYKLPNSSGATGTVLDQISDSTDDINSGLGTAGTNTDKNIKKAKEWKNVLMGFDVANVLPSQSDSSTSGSSGSSGTGGLTVDPRILEALQNYDYLFDDIHMKANDIRDAILKWWNSPLEEKFKWLADLLADIDFYGIGEKIAQLPNKAIEIINSIDWGSVFSSLWDILGNGVVGALNLIKGFIENFDWKGLIEAVLNVIVGILKSIPSLVKNILKVGFAALDLVVSIGVTLLKTAAELWLEFSKNVNNWRISIENTLKNKADELWKWFNKNGVKWSVGITNFLNNSAEKLNKDFSDAWKRMSSKAVKIANNLASSASTLFNNFKKSWGERKVAIKNSLASGASSIWRSFKKAWEKAAKAGLKIKVVLSAITDGVKKWFNTTVIDKLNKYWSRVPILGNYKIPHLAKGGFPDVGQLFIAREAGPELVGTMGGKNVVANNAQITNGIYRAVLEAIKDGGNVRNSGGDLYITIKNEDGTEIKKIIRNYNQYMRSTGGKGGFEI